MATSGTIEADARRDALERILRRDGVIRLTESAAELGVSVMTVRRDLADLESAGTVRRVRGGAVAGTGPRPFSERRSTRAREKARIAEKLRDLVPAAGAIALDASSTSDALADLLDDHGGLTVVTNSSDVQASLRRSHPII